MRALRRGFWRYWVKYNVGEEFGLREIFQMVMVIRK